MIMYTYMSDPQIPVRKKKEAESSTARESQQYTQNRRQKSETLPFCCASKISQHWLFPSFTASQHASPHQTPVFGIIERFPTRNGRPSSCPAQRPSLPMFPSLNPAPMSNTDFAVPYHLSPAGSTRLLTFGIRNPMVSLETSEVFFTSLPLLLQQRIDALASSSLRLEQVASSARRSLCSASIQFPNPVLSSNEDGLMSRRAAEQQGLLYQLQNDLQRSCGGRGSTSATSTNPPIQWPSSPVGLGVGDTEAISSLPIHPRWPQRVSTSLPMPSTTSMLSCAASMTELASPFTKEEEGRIPQVSGPESFPMVLHRALTELELIRGAVWTLLRSYQTVAPFTSRTKQVSNRRSFQYSFPR